MNDTATPKDYLLTSTSATNLPGSARSFPRVQSTDSQNRRQSLHISSLSPCVLRIGHQVRKNSTGVQKSICSIDQTLTRLDALSNPISSTKFSIAVQANIPGDVTLVEFQAAASILLGFLLETNAANLTALYNAEF